MQVPPSLSLPAAGEAAAAGSGVVSRTRSSSSSSTSSLRSRRAANLTLDLSGLPPLEPPVAPTNTLHFTNLNHADVFAADSLQRLRGEISAVAEPQTWTPLKSFRRILASFRSAEDATRVRALWDGRRVAGNQGQPCQIFFGPHTDVSAAGRAPAVQHLALPDAGKLFFISPPPSPPHDWEMRLEGAPNKQVHAEDLAEALARLHHRAAADGDEDVAMRSPVSDHETTSASSSAAAVGAPAPGARTRRSRSSTLVIYQPSEHSSRPDLPAIAVEDLTAQDDDEDADMLDGGYLMGPAAPIMAHTARPPVELMHEA